MFWSFKNFVCFQSQVLAAAGLATIFALGAMRLFHNAAQSWNGSCIGKNALYARMLCQRATLNWWMVLNWDMEERCKYIPSSLQDLKPNVASKLIDWRNAGLITNKQSLPSQVLAKLFGSWPKTLAKEFGPRDKIGDRLELRWKPCVKSMGPWNRLEINEFNFGGNHSLQRSRNHRFHADMAQDDHDSRWSSTSILFFHIFSILINFLDGPTYIRAQMVTRTTNI